MELDALKSVSSAHNSLFQKCAAAIEQGCVVERERLRNNAIDLKPKCNLDCSGEHNERPLWTRFNYNAGLEYQGDRENSVPCV